MTDDQPHILDVLASQIRREILWLTWSDELSAGEIAEHFDVSAPTVSQHLKVLRDAELVTMTVDGTFRRYRARQDRLSSLEPYLRETAVEKWVLGEALQPAGDSVSSEVINVARIRVRLPIDPVLAFNLNVQADQLARWAGDNVTSDPRSGGHFRFDLMGHTCRGVYSRFHPPSVLAFQWGFGSEDEVPSPSDLYETILLFSAAGDHTDLEVQQVTASAEEAEFIAMAWTDRIANLRRLADELAG